MKCKRHLYDTTSTIGVCASCLRERLLAVIAERARNEQEADKAASAKQPPPPSATGPADRRKPDPRPPRQQHHHDHPPPPQPPRGVLFPSSVSPYISRSKSSATEHHWATPDHRHSRFTFYTHRFFSTPQVGPGFRGGDSEEDDVKKKKRKQGSRFGLISNLFRSRSRNYGLFDPDSDPEPRVSVPSPSFFEAWSSSPASNSPFSWISGFDQRRSEKKKSKKTTIMRMFAFEATTAAGDEEDKVSRTVGAGGRTRRYCGEEGWDDGSPSPAPEGRSEVQDEVRTDDGARRRSHIPEWFGLRRNKKWKDKF